MKILRFLIILTALVCKPFEATCAENDANDVLSLTLDALRKVHTARYVMTEHEFNTPTDSVYLREKVRRVIECENPADTSENAKSLILYLNGKLERAYDGDNTYYELPGGYIEKNSMANHFGVRYIQPPFFNHAKHLCEYLLEPSDKITVTLEEEDSTWLVRAEVREWQQVCFFGKPYISPSMAYTKSYFGLRINKKDMMPVWMSYLMWWPQLKYERTISDVEINPVAPADFVFSDYLPELPIYSGEEAQKRDRETTVNKASLDETLPTDTLQLSTGGTVSLADLGDKVKVIMFTLEHCGPCGYAYPVVNAIYDSYPTDSVAVYGVLWGEDFDIAGVKRFAETHNLRFPLAKNNGHFYQHFFPSGYAPNIFVVGRDNRVEYWQRGINPDKTEKAEKRLRQAIDKALHPLRDLPQP